MRRLQGDRAIVTGASSGIGREIARQLAAAGVDLVLVARRAERLEALAAQLRPTGRRIVGVAGDITDPSVRGQCLAAARDELGGLDLLINNAGVSDAGRFADSTPERLRWIMEVNFFAPVELIREALPLLAQSGRGLVVNVGSILGHRAIPRRANYCASKFALQGVSESLRAELATDRIGVVLVSPGATETELYEHAPSSRTDDPWRSPPAGSPDDVARATLRAIQKEKREVFPHFRGRLLVLANRLAPRLVDRWMRRYG
jgi:short-subunit dehydrogenase